MLGTEMIHFVHQMQYYITFEVRTLKFKMFGKDVPYGYVILLKRYTSRKTQKDLLC